MSTNSTVRIAVAQYSQLDISAPFEQFADSVRRIAATSQNGTRPDVIVFPEMHLFGTGDADRDTAQRLQTASATNLHDAFTQRLGSLARECGVWLIPGTVCEYAPDNGIYNTAVVFSPDGTIAATYRKICPWRPYEWYVPGNSFTVFDIPGKGRVGLTICYDAWFPEITRQVAWLGAELVINLVRTTTPDRRQELILAPANAITNQVSLISVNAAAPQGVGQSIAVNAEGDVIAETTDDSETLFHVDVDFDAVRDIRAHGTEGLNRPWRQFREADGTIDLPMYDGHITASLWHLPHESTEHTATDKPEQS